jgi:hypothetical protein
MSITFTTSVLSALAAVVVSAVTIGATIGPVLLIA